MNAYWRFAVIPLLLAVAGWIPTAQAEPYLAVRTNNQCAACHVNPTGGGKRTEYGALYARTALAAEEWKIPADNAAGTWDGRINNYFAIGGDLRTSLRYIDVKQTDSFSFDTDAARIYLELSVIPNRVLLYIDQTLAPGAAVNRESFLLLWSKEKTTYLKAGRIFIPYGWRIEDDSAYIRQFSGVNFTSSDTGVETGFVRGGWSTQFAITNGAAASETDRGKQYSLLTSYLRGAWRVGTSFSYNDHDTEDRKMANVFFGLRTGLISWLAQADQFEEELTAGRRESQAGFVEANIEVARGHNLKLTFDSYNPDRNVANDQRDRVSVVWEYTPFQFLQVRAGYRRSDGASQSNAQDADELFVQLHTFL